tara:strand:+ start:1391 stop:1981 length:591 start_codon:yes stop_codon:yes gene_type:complete
MENWRNFLKEDSTPLVVVYFGGFKPPHKGHVAVVEEYLSMPNVEKVYILFGNSPRKSMDRSVVLDGSHSQQVWNLFKSSMSQPDKVKILPPTSLNTMIAAAEMAWLPELTGKQITAGFGAKEPKYGQSFVRLVDSLSKKKGHPVASPVAVPTKVNLPSISASKIREALAAKDVTFLQSVLPSGVSIDQYINILSNT